MKETQISAITFFEILFTLLAVTMFMLYNVAPLRSFGLVFATTVFSLVAMTHSVMHFKKDTWTSLAFMVVSLSIFGLSWSAMPLYL